MVQVFCLVPCVLEMSVVRGVGEVCDMCMCLARAVWVERGGEWMRG